MPGAYEAAVTCVPPLPLTAANVTSTSMVTVVPVRGLKAETLKLSVTFVPTFVT